MRIQPLDDKVLVEPLDALPTSSEGMVVMQSGVLLNRAVVPGEEECQRAIVVALGPAISNFRVGGTVLIAKYATLDMNNNLNVRMPGREVTLDGKKLRMIDYNEVLGVFEREPARKERRREQAQTA